MDPAVGDGVGGVVADGIDHDVVDATVNDAQAPVQVQLRGKDRVVF